MDPDMVEGEEEVKLSRLDDTSEEPPEGDYDNAESQYQQEEEEEEGQHIIVPQFQQDDEEEEEGQHIIVPQFQQDDEEEEERETEIVPGTQTQQDEEEEEEDDQIKIVPKPHLQQEEEEDEEEYEERQQTEMVPEPQLQDEEEAAEEEDEYEEIRQIQQEKEEDEQQTETLPEEFQQEEEEEQEMQINEEQEIETIPKSQVQQEAEVQQKTVTENEAPRPPVRKPLPAAFLNRELTIGDIVRFLGETAAENNATESATAIVRSAIRAARGTEPQTPEEKRKQDLNNANNEKNAEIKKDKQSPAEIEEAKKEELLKEAARQEALLQQAMLEQAKLEAEEKLAMIQKQLETMEHLPPNMQEQLSSLLHDINDMVAQKLAEIKPAPKQGEATEGEFIQEIPEPPKEEPKTWDYALEIEPCAPFYHPPDLGIGSTSEPKSRTTERSTTSTPVEKPNTGSPVQHERTDSPTQDRKSNIQWQHEQLQGNRRLFPLPPPPKPYVMPCKLKLEMVALQTTERKL